MATLKQPIEYVLGVDPGLVDTGIVRYRFDRMNRHVEVQPAVISGGDADKIASRMAALVADGSPCFIEAYRPRGGMNTNARMVALVNDIKRIYGDSAKVLPNTGIKTVVKPALLNLMGSQQSNFIHIRTNHGDLVSAARIALLGMMKDKELNQLLTTVVEDHTSGNGTTWTVRVV